jgi:hypothetical protein
MGVECFLPARRPKNLLLRACAVITHASQPCRLTVTINISTWIMKSFPTGWQQALRKDGGIIEFQGDSVGCDLMKPSYDCGESGPRKRQCCEQLPGGLHKVGQYDPFASSLLRGLGAEG